MTALFRTEVIQNQTSEFGVPLGLARGWTGLYSLVLLAAIIAGMSVVAFGTYPRKAHVIGYLAPDLGIIKIMSPRGGRVVEMHVTEGAVVAKDDVLFVVDISGISGAGPTNDLLADNLKTRRRLIQDELQRLDTVHVSDRRRLEAEIDGYRRQKSALEQNLTARLAFADLAKHALDRAITLEGKGTYSLLQRETAESQWAGANAQVADLRNSLASAVAALAQAEAGLQGLADKQAVNGEVKFHRCGKVNFPRLMLGDQPFFGSNVVPLGGLPRLGGWLLAG